MDNFKQEYQCEFINDSVRICDLHYGDRFSTLDNIYTLIEFETDAAICRKHGLESIKLKDKGFGYYGDSIVNFELEDKVNFIPVNKINL